MLLPTVDQLAAAVGCSRRTAEIWQPLIRESCALYDITGPSRLAPYLATIGCESASLSSTSENLNYSPQRLRQVCSGSPAGSRWHALLPRVAQLARNPQALANAAYAGRMGNGDEASGDGWKYRGHGLLQCTGKANHEAMTELLLERMRPVPDFGTEPGALAEPRWAAFSAAALWHEWGLNDMADADDFLGISRRVNLGDKRSRAMPNGWDDRRARLQQARKVLA